jgi:prophage DNA circulation protein
MTECRDWLTSLWPGSYKGVSFWFESDDESGGRGLVIHEFPHRDDPFVEDLGEAPRFFEGAIYIHGDDVDAQAARLTETFASKGPGSLVLPIRGPVSVHCQEFRRSHQRDKLGYVAYTAKFVRAGAAGSLVSLPYAARLVTDAADRLAAALAGLFPRRVATLAQPDFVVAAAVEGVQAAAAALDVVRLQNAVDPATSAKVREGVTALVASAPLLLSRSDTPGEASDLLAVLPEIGAATGAEALAAGLVAAVRRLADAMPAPAAQAAMADYIGAHDVARADTYLAPTAARAAENVAEVARLARLAGLTAWAEALMRRNYASRPDGVTARGEAAERFEDEMAACFGAADAALYIAIGALRDAVVDYLTALIVDLAPVVTVESSAIMPSLWWSWRLYATPARAGELVGRNGVRHPSFMPRRFQALAS